MLVAEAAVLQSRFGRHGSVAFEASPLGGIVAVLSAEGGSRAVVSLFGGQVLSWRPRPGEHDALWCSAHARLDCGKAFRGGIPICWPWFGPHPNSELNLPSHGFVRTAPWDVARSDVQDGCAVLTLTPRLTVEQQAIAGPGVSLTARVTVGDDLIIELITTNAGAMPVTISQALHTYFPADDIGAVRVEGLDGHSYLDQLTGQERVQNGALLISEETDRIYWGSAASVSVRGANPGRLITVVSEGSASTVVWNPWAVKAARLGDMAPESFRNMLCVETANAAPRDAVAIAVGGAHRLVMRMSCSKS